MGYSFVLYKHGPYSFDLKLDTSRLLGRRMLKQEPSAPPYGPRLRATTIMSNHVARHHEAIGRHSKDITRVVQFVGSRGVAELERLSTALYVTVQNEEESIYKHGPYSFDLKLDTSRLLGRRMLKQEPSAPPYGPRLRATTIMSNHVARHHEAIGRHSKDITRVVQFVGSRGVAELERLSTALYVTVQNEEESIPQNPERNVYTS